MRSLDHILADMKGVEPPPAMCLPALEAWAASGRLGRDMNGGILYSEMRSWLDEQGILDRSLRRVYERLFFVAESVRAELRELRKKDADRKDNGGFAGAVKKK